MWTAVRTPITGQIYMLLFAAQLIFAMFTATFALFTLNRLGFNGVNNAIFFGIFGILLVLIQGYFVGRWVPRFGEYRILLVSLVLTLIGFGLAAFTPQQAVPWYSEAAMVAELAQQGDGQAQLGLLPSESGAGWGALIFILITLLPAIIGYTLQMPTLNTLLTNRADPSEIGQALGLSASFVGAGSVIGPLLGGWLFDQFSPAAPFMVSAVLSLVLLILMIQLRPSTRTAAVPATGD